MVSYWIKGARNTFENTYWLKKIDLIFITSTEDQQQWRGKVRSEQHENVAITEVCKMFGEISRTMTYTTRNTVNRLVRKELHLNPVVPNDQWKNKAINRAPET